MRMRCHEVKNQLNALVDEELGVVATWRVTRHVARCAACAAELSEIKRLGQQARQWRQVTPSVELKERIGAAVAASVDNRVNSGKHQSGVLARRLHTPGIWRPWSIAVGGI